MDQDSAFMSSLMTYLLNKFNIKIKTVALHNHQHLTNLGQMWPKYLPFPTFAYSTFNTPNLGNHSPSELIFGRKPISLHNLDSTSDIKVSGTFKDYYDLLKKRLKYLHNLL